MSMLSSKLRDIEGGRLLFWCPGCKDPHMVNTRRGERPCWTWNGDAERPTLSPSVLTYHPDGQPPRCHLFLREGRIQFLGDCTHELAGQTVDLPDLPEAWR